MLYKLSLLSLLYFVCNLLTTSADNEEKVLHYTVDTFPVEIPKNNHFVMFYAPWCGHCKRLHPTWEQLAEMLNEDEDSQVTIAKVDCTVHNTLCSENDVTGYPTLKFFKLGTTEGIKFRGTRDLPSLTSFINEQLGNSPQEEITQAPVTLDGLTELTEASFGKHTQQGNHFVKFYAPWCGHCQKLAPTWEDLAKSLQDDSSVGIAKVDCTVQRSVCSNLEIKGYPTLLWIQDGKVVEKYSGQRSQEDLKTFVRKMQGVKEDMSDSSESAEDVQTLTGETFAQGISNGVTFVKFFAPWCGHCKRLAPTWAELGKKIQGRTNVKLVKVDCTLDNSKDLCNEQEVEGFPTLYLYKNGERLSEYNGSRNLEDLHEFLSKHFHHDEL